MASFSFSHSGANAILSYAYGGVTYRAAVRATEANYDYSLNSTESHSRLYRAFYPHRRAFGSMNMTITCKNRAEYKVVMGWLKNYTDALLNNGVSNSGSTVIMHVQLPSRNFDRYGIVVSGIDDHDHVGSMVFNVPLSMVTLKDNSDAAISILTSSQVSQFHAPQVDTNNSLAFYPSSSYKYVDQEIYDIFNNAILPLQQAIDQIQQQQADAAYQGDNKRGPKS